MESKSTGHHPLEYMIVGAIFFGSGLAVNNATASAILQVIGGLMFFGGLGMLVTGRRD